MAPQPSLRAARGLPATAELQHDLAKIRYLLAILERLPAAATEGFDDLAWLRGRQRCLGTILAGRAAMRRRKIVDLSEWRHGGLDAVSHAQVA